MCLPLKLHLIHLSFKFFFTPLDVRGNPSKKNLHKNPKREALPIREATPSTRHNCPNRKATASLIWGGGSGSGSNSRNSSRSSSNIPPRPQIIPPSGRVKQNLR